MVKLSLNTYYHTKEQIGKAEMIMNVLGMSDWSEDEANAYGSMLIHSNFSIEHTNVMYDRLQRKGHVTLDEFYGRDLFNNYFNSEVGWEKPWKPIE